MQNETESEQLETDNLKSNLFQPGAAKFGNFINYYTFNSVNQRLQAIPINFLENLQLKQNPILCLDVGCNSGELTRSLFSQLKSQTDEDIIMLGIDLDENLISRCTENNEHDQELFYEQLNIMDAGALSKLTSFLQNYRREKFDVTTCFSTTMWIHLNYGDDGLKTFLELVSKISNCLLLEPQQWKSYKSAIRRMTRLKREVFNLENLKNKDIIPFIKMFLETECKMKLEKSYGETSWGRSLYMFKRCDK